jgi:ribosomal protein S18 acetylase RimI-like enzyme
MMEKRPLNDCSFSEIRNAFNESFSDYLVPLQLTPEQLEGKIKTDKVDLNYSVGAFSGNKLVGFILHGFDILDNKKVIYNAGTGVIPGYRKQGLTKQMYDFILPYLSAENIDILSLEVITQNIPAIRSYEKVGFKAKRKLVCYRGEVNTTTNEQVNITEIPAYDWERIKEFWDFSPSWQNSIRVLESLKNTNTSYGAFLEDQLVGYMVYNPVSKRVQQFGVDKKYRRKKIASALFAHIKEPGTNVTIINADESSVATIQFLAQIGLEKFVEQIEMELELG